MPISECPRTNADESVSVDIKYKQSKKLSIRAKHSGSLRRINSDNTYHLVFPGNSRGMGKIKQISNAKVNENRTDRYYQLQTRMRLPGV